MDDAVSSPFFRRGLGQDIHGKERLDATGPAGEVRESETGCVLHDLRWLA
jgi:hypothetical protein